jgi:ABC-type glycerol-3-phosphate transport system substrate-binding protein
MKNISKIFLAALSLIVVLTACNKIDNLYKLDALPLYEKGMSPVLAVSSASVAATLADSSKSIVTFSWTNPKYSNDSATTKYIIEIDTTGSNFTKALQIITIGALSSSPTGRELNAILLNLGFSVLFELGSLKQFQPLEHVKRVFYSFLYGF